MYKKYLIIASKKDKAGVNITTNLSQFRQNPVLLSMKENAHGFDFYLVEDEVIYTRNLDMDKINQYDFIIFASKHKSEKKEKTLSIHAPGNWRRAISRIASKNSEVGSKAFSRERITTETSEGAREAQLKEEAEKVSRTSAMFQKQMFEKLNSNVKEHSLDEKYKVTLECTHHGPLIDKPCIFIEIGSSETEWADRKAGFIIAKTINQIIREFKPNPYNEIAIGIGGPHYCPNFNKVQLNSNIALSHIIPRYALPLKEEMVKQALEKTEEEVDFALLDWKGLGNAKQRQQVTDILGKLYVNYKKTSEVGK